MLKAAKHPLILVGRVSRDLDAWNRRVALAEAIGARVASSLQVRRRLPDRSSAASRRRQPRTTARTSSRRCAEADVILSLDWVDLAGTLKSLGGPPSGKVIQVSIDHHVHNGWSMDYRALPPVDLLIAADPDAVVQRCSQALGSRRAKPRPAVPRRQSPKRHPAARSRSNISRLRCATRSASAPARSRICRFPGTAPGGRSAIRSTISAPTAAAGSAAAPASRSAPRSRSRDRGRLPIAICGDGDFLMGVTAIWTAVHYRIPLLIVVANNRSFYNDEVHQERVARMRNRPVENKWIGQRISDPDRSRRARARAGRARLRAGQGTSPICRRSTPRRSPRSKPARSRSSTCASSPAMRPRVAAAMCGTEAGPRG